MGWVNCGVRVKGLYQMRDRIDLGFSTGIENGAIDEDYGTKSESTSGYENETEVLRVR